MNRPHPDIGASAGVWIRLTSLFAALLGECRHWIYEQQSTPGLGRVLFVYIYQQTLAAQRETNRLKGS